MADTTGQSDAIIAAAGKSLAVNRDGGIHRRGLTPSIGRGSAEPVAATKTLVSPKVTMTDPPACLAHLPDSILISLPPTTTVSMT